MFCESKAYPAENKPEKARFFCLFYFQKNKGVQKKQIFKIWLQKSQIGNPATQELRMRIKGARKLSIFVMHRSRENLVFYFPAERLSNA